MKKQGVYAFGVISTPKSKLKINNVLRISFKDLTLIGKIVSIDNFQKKIKEALKNPHKMEKVLKEYQTIQDKIMKKTTLVPFQFGTILKNKDGAVEYLKSSYARYKEFLKKFKDRQEWGVRVFADLKKFRASIAYTNQKDTQKSSSGTTYLLRKKQEEEADKTRTEKLNLYCQEVFSLLGKVALKVKVTGSSQRFSEKGEILASSFAFLVNKNKAEEFKEKVAALQNKFQSQGLRLRLSGPWPAYNFL